MNPAELNERLSRIKTHWTMVFQAHGAEADAVVVAQRELVQRYSGAVYRYLLGAVRDPDVASDLCQEFALRLLRGDFRRADPQRGRFRDYLKTALIHLVTDHHRERQAAPRLLPPDSPEPPAPSEEDSERDFLRSWREELLERTWQALAEAKRDYHAVLLLRVANRELSSPQMAEELSRQLDRPVNAAWVRQVQHRAQERFAELLLDEVASSLDGGGEEELREELQALDLLRYCRSALDRRGRKC